MELLLTLVNGFHFLIVSLERRRAMRHVKSNTRSQKLGV